MQIVQKKKKKYRAAQLSLNKIKNYSSLRKKQHYHEKNFESIKN